SGLSKVIIAHEKRTVRRARGSLFQVPQQQLYERSYSLWSVLLDADDQSKVIVGPYLIWLQTDAFPQMRCRIFQVSLQIQDSSQRVLQLGIVLPSLEKGLEKALGRLELTLTGFSSG